MRKYVVALVGIGLVGTEIVRVLKEREFPLSELRIMATRDREEDIDGETYEVTAASLDRFRGVDFAFFAGTEGARGASREWGWRAVEAGAIVIDNGDDFRMDSRVPLVVPEVNPDALRNHHGFVANPNCSTIQMVVALAPLHRVARIKRVVVSSYQAVSGTGKAAVDELMNQVATVLRGEPVEPSVYPHPIAFNCFPHISGLRDEYPGYYGEEIKMIKETRKILGEPDLAVTATCVRVPVFSGHSEAVNVQFELPISAEEAREVLARAPGVLVVDKPEEALYPTPRAASGRDEVMVGRIRQDPSAENALDLWVVADNIRKGAALNAVQIAEKMIEMGLR
ncbi:MAG: aspartate-semialdehyde dehydrogenase [Anaerolineae bacterium]|nr:aspartate-semialdehyde dehydrogenase [Anaerolineae bacterium]